MEQKRKRKATMEPQLRDDLINPREIKQKVSDLSQEIQESRQEEGTDLFPEPSPVASFEELFNSVINREVVLREKKDSNKANPDEIALWYNLRDRIADWLKYAISILKEQGVTSEEIAAVGAQDRQVELCFEHMMKLYNEGLIPDCGRFILVGNSLNSLVRGSSANSNTSEVSITTQSTNPENTGETYEAFANYSSEVSFEKESLQVSDADPPQFAFEDTNPSAHTENEKEESKSSASTGFGRILHQLNSSSSLEPASDIQSKEVHSLVGQGAPLGEGNLPTSKQEVPPIEQQRATHINPYWSFVGNSGNKNLESGNQVLPPSNLGTPETDTPSSSPTKR